MGTRLYLLVFFLSLAGCTSGPHPDSESYHPTPKPRSPRQGSQVSPSPFNDNFSPINTDLFKKKITGKDIE